MKHAIATFALLIAAVSPTISIADGTSGPIKEKLSPEVFNRLTDEERLDLASGLIRCRTLPTSESALRAAITKAEESGNMYAASSLEEHSQVCLGLAPEDFQQVERILRQLAQKGVVEAQLNYWRYVSPTPGRGHGLSGEETSNRELARNSERYLMSAARAGEHMALMHLAQLHFSGELKSREYGKAAAYIAAYEVCSGRAAPPEANSILASARGLEDEIARRSESLIREVGCNE